MFQLWELGVILILVGSVGNNLGNNLVSLGHHEIHEEKEKDSIPKESSDVEHGTETKSSSETKKRPCSLWTIGIIIFVLGNLCTFAAFGFGAQSLLASLESVQFVSNVIFVKYVHKEVVTWKMLISTASIIGGNTLVVIFSDHAAVLYTSGQLLQLYSANVPYQVYLGVALFVWGLNHYLYTKYYYSRVEEKKLLWKHQFMEPFTFALSSAIIGTQAVLQSKCMSILIQDSARGDDEFKKPTLYVILVVWLMLVSYWLNRLNKGLELFPPLFIIPVMQVFFVFFAILSGGIYFQEFETFNSSQWGGFVAGVLMILGGVFGLAPLDDDLVTCEDSDNKDANEESVNNSRDSTNSVDSRLSRNSRYSRSSRHSRSSRISSIEDDPYGFEMIPATHMSAALEVVGKVEERLSARLSKRVADSLNLTETLNFDDVYEGRRSSFHMGQIPGLSAAPRPVSKRVEVSAPGAAGSAAVGAAGSAAVGAAGSAAVGVAGTAAVGTAGSAAVSVTGSAAVDAAANDDSLKTSGGLDAISNPMVKH